ncbi:MAG TPA: methionine aminotransferase [Burkholderiaceae bacterium]|jgi:methionine aminotransferase|nr:methionine aminotransferase [Burkholderiaceae bacterium]
MRRIPTSSKLPRVGTTIFTVMSQLAARHDAVNLGQGFPDFDCDPRLQQRLTEAMHAGHNQYALMPGVTALREAIANKNQAVYGHRHDPDVEITITAGATQALMATMLALVHAGDEVIVLEPAYDSYAPAVALAGGRPVFVTLDHAAGYAPNWEAVRAAMTSKTRLILINFPHNPTGRVLRQDDIVALERIVNQTGVLLVSDEVYEHVVFDGVAHYSIMRSPLLAAHSVVISSFGKTFHTTGWKVGYACAPPAISAEIRKVHQFMVFAVNTPAQYAIAEHLKHPQPYLDLPNFYQAKRDLFIRGLARTSFRALACEGTYFVLADYSQISDLNEEEFAKKLVAEYGVASIPVSVFYNVPVDHQVVRFCFAKNDSTLNNALARLSAL